MKKLLFIALLFLAFVFSCKENTITEPIMHEVTISGRVIDSTGISIDSCLVTLVTETDSIKLVTNSDGLFSFSFSTNQIDSARLIFYKYTYLLQTLIISDLLENSKQDLTINLEESYIISGFLFELDETGAHPSVNTTVKFGTNWSDLDMQTTTNEAGKFLFEIDKKLIPDNDLANFYLKADKAEYTVHSNDYAFAASDSVRQNIILYLSYDVYYLPIKIGNKWEFEAIRGHGDTYAYFEYSGKEIWEIIDISQDCKYLNIKTTFIGKYRSKTWSTWNYEKDTTLIKNYELMFEDGYIKPRVEGGITNEISGILFNQLLTSNGLYTYEYDYRPQYYKEYTLSFSRGIENFKEIDNRLHFRNSSLILLNFTEGE